LCGKSKHTRKCEKK